MSFQFTAKQLIFTFTNKIFSRNSALPCHGIYFSVLPQILRNIHVTASLSELVRFNLADIGEGIREVSIKEWYIKVGDRVSQFDNICEVQSDKAAVTITSRYDGVVKKIYHEIDEIASVGKPLIDIELDSAMEEEQVINEPSEETMTSDYATNTVSHHNVSTTPSVRRIAKENNINLSEVIGTGPQGRVMKEDVLNYVKNKSLPKEKTSKPIEEVSKKVEQKSSSVHLPRMEIKSEDKVVPIKGLMKGMFKSMTIANSIPHFSFCDEINMNSLAEMKNSIASVSSGTKITFMPFFIKAASIALLQYPQLNAQLDGSGDNLIHKASHNIGFALDTPEGLIVPKVRSVQTKSIIDIAKEISQLIEKGKLGKLSPTDLADGTFTISNVGNIGGTYTKPIILPPEVVIGGIGKIQTLPRYNEKGEVVATKIMQISWSADHRVVDGATIAKFSNLWKSFLESPELLLLHLR